MKVRFLNLAIENENERNMLLDAIDRVFQHGQIILGPEVEEFEEKAANYCGVKYAVGVNSGTDALYLALRSLDIGPDDEVITSCLSWIATANAIALTGAKPVFADIKDNFNIDPQKVEELITPKTKAIVPVHFTGKICDMFATMEIAHNNNLSLVEDAAQAFGAAYRGRRAGSFGQAAAFSLNPMKVFAACGEAGVIVTNDRELYAKLKALRYNGTPDKSEARYISLNARIDTLQAAILLHRFKSLDESIEKRRKAAQYYSLHLHDLVKTPGEDENCRDVFYTYNILCEKRDELKDFLLSKEVETKIHHPLLMPMHPAYKSGAQSWPTGLKVTAASLCLPIHEKISREEQDYVIKAIQTFYTRSM